MNVLGRRKNEGQQVKITDETPDGTQVKGSDGHIYLVDNLTKAETHGMIQIDDEGNFEFQHPRKDITFSRNGINWVKYSTEDRGIKPQSQFNKVGQ